MNFSFTDREKAGVLAALRHWQSHTDHHDRWQDDTAICAPHPGADHWDCQSPLTDSEIDQLYSRLADTNPDTSNRS
jgi:hypothetical protein